MTEKQEPDFEKTARAIVGWLYVPSDMADPAVEIPAAVTHVVERLRQVWNARGAADAEAVKQLLGTKIFADEALDAIRSVDR